MKSLVAMVCFVATVTAHVCLLNPHQRGSMMMDDLNNPESSDCGLTIEPCGNRSAATPIVEITKGSAYTVIFQKNLNHFHTYDNGTSTNGYFQVGFWTRNVCQVLTKIPDTATPSLTIYTAPVTMPQGPTGVPGILQVIYVTDNPDAPARFYQCSDVVLV